jgi:hypothetical protein
LRDVLSKHFRLESDRRVVFKAPLPNPHMIADLDVHLFDQRFCGGDDLLHRA